MMVTKVKTIESRQGEEVNTEIIDPLLVDIERIIIQMDGETKNQTILFITDDHHMFIGGGGDKFVVYVTFDNERYWNLTNLSAPDSLTEVMIGYQETEYPEKLCITIDKVAVASSVFAETGGLASSLHWSE